MKNLEIKVPATDLELLQSRAKSAGARPVARLHQVDTFYRASQGLLKLREVRGGSAELIAYQRPRDAGSRTSDYLLYPTDDPARLKAVLDRSLETVIEVRKLRDLWMLVGTRIHLDTVEGLGTFVELETEADLRPDAEVRREHTHVLQSLALDLATAIPGTYAEMLLGRPLETILPPVG